MMLARMVPTITVPEFIKRRTAEITAFCLATVGLVVGASLLTYHADDSSLNHLSDAPVRNALGFFGASLADMLKQTIGWMSALVMLASFGWAWRLLAKDDAMRMAWRVVALIGALVSGSTLLALLAASTHAGWLHSASGAMGILVAFKLVPLLSVLGTAGLMAVACSSNDCCQWSNPC